MVALLVVGPMTLPEHRAPGGRRLDLPSAALSILAVLPFVYGLKQLAADGPSAAATAAILLGLVSGVVFVRRQHRLADPMIDLHLFASSALTTATLTLVLGIFVLWGTNYAVAQYLQLVAGLSPLAAGLWTAPSAIGVIVGSLGASRLARRVPAGRIIGGGMLVAAAGFAVLTTISPTSPLGVLVTGTIIVSAGLGPMMALATDLVVGSAPSDRAGAASAIASTAPQLGGGLGIAVLGSVITLVYRSTMNTTGPDGDTLSAAVTTAALLPPADGATLLTAARSAFTTGFAVSAVVALVLTVLTAVAVLIALRNRDS
jgi:DHA2 family multidrug resistance protein-like MFS transporter